MQHSNFKYFYTILKRRTHYRRLVIGGAISQLGDWLSYIALSSLALRVGDVEGAVGTGVAVASVYLAHSLPHVFAAPIVGPLVDRYSRRAIMIGSYLGASLLTLAMYIQIESVSLWLIQGLLCLRVMVSNAGMNARQAALPALVTSEELTVAHALNSSVWSVLFTLGVALGGVITASLGPAQAIAIDALTYLVSVSCIWSLPALLPQDKAGIYSGAAKESATGSAHSSASASSVSATTEATSESGLTDPSYSLGDAIKFARAIPRLWVPLFAKSPIEFFHGLGWIALNIIAAASGPEQSALLLGVFTAVRGLGIGLGPALLGANREVNFILIQVITCGAVTTFILSEFQWLSLGALLVWGMCGGVNWVGSTVMLQKHTPPHLLGRITALDFLSFTLFQSIATLWAGWIYDRAHSLTYMLFVIGGAGSVALMILSALGWRARLSSRQQSSR